VRGVICEFVGCYTISGEVGTHPLFMVLVVPLIKRLTHIENLCA
jgi:hypothetical protein